MSSWQPQAFCHVERGGQMVSKITIIKIGATLHISKRKLCGRPEGETFSQFSSVMASEAGATNFNKINRIMTRTVQKILAD